MKWIYTRTKKLILSGSKGEQEVEKISVTALLTFNEDIKLGGDLLISIQKARRDYTVDAYNVKMSYAANRKKDRMTSNVRVLVRKNSRPNERTGMTA